MNDRDREAFILSEGREPAEADERLFEAFLPEGSIGRFGVRYGMFNTDNGLLYNVFISCLTKYRIASGSFSASDFHPYMSCVTKRSYYRPTDEIWTFDGAVTRTSKIKKYFNHYASSLYAVYENCRSFAIDLYTAGCNIEGLAGRSYFIFPAGSGKAAGLVPYAYGLRKCGVVTSDDRIRIFSGESETASLPKAIIPPIPEAAPLCVNDPLDFNVGYLTALSEVVGILSPYVFPFDSRYCSGSYNNTVVYRLGYTAGRMRYDKAPFNANKGTITDPSGLYLYLLPLNYNVYAVSMQSADAIVRILSAYRPGRGCLAAGFTAGSVNENMFPGYTISGYTAPAGVYGGAILLTDSPMEGIFIGRLVKILQ